MSGAHSYAPRRRTDDEEEEEKQLESYTYADPETYTYGSPSTEEGKLDLDGLYSYSGTTPAPPPAPAAPQVAPPVPAQAVPKGDDDDFASFFKGGRISSRAMRAYEVAQRRKAQGGGAPPPPAATPVPSSTERKRAAIAAAIPKTPKYNAKGEDLDAVVNGTGGLRGTRLVDEYEGEDTKVGWRGKNINKERFAESRDLTVGTPEFDRAFQAFVEGSTTVTDYDTTPEARERSRLKRDQFGDLAATHERRPGFRQSNRKAEEVGWVMDPATANVHTFDQGRQVRQNRQAKNTHHSTPLAGGDVAGAGLMTLKHGEVREITDESGHYRPDAAYTHQAVGKMAEQKLLDRAAKPEQRRKAGPGTVGAKVTLAGYAEHDPRQAKGWLKDEKDIFKGPLTLPYQAFLQGGGNERQMRAKAENLGDVKVEARKRKRRQMQRAKQAWREGGEVGPKPTWTTGKKRGEAQGWGPTEITPEESRRRSADRKAELEGRGNEQEESTYDVDPGVFQGEEKDGDGGGSAPIFYTLDQAEQEQQEQEQQELDAGVGGGAPQNPNAYAFDIGGQSEEKESEDDGGLDLDGVMYTLDDSELEEEEEEKSGYRYSVGTRR